MADIIQRGDDGLPVIADKELAAMDRLFCDGRYQIKKPARLFSAKKDAVNPAFITRTLDEYVRHINTFRASSRKVVTTGAKATFIAELKVKNSTAVGIIDVALAIEVKTLNDMLNNLQRATKGVSVAELQPFIRTLYKQLIRIYYLEPEFATSCLMDAYRLVVDRYVPANAEELRSNALTAIQELQYIYDKIFPQTYPLVLRMTSPVMMSEKDLFYKNGSKVLSWLDVHPDQILFPGEETYESPIDEDEEESPEEEEETQIPENVSDGLKMLEKLFPQAGWEKILNFPKEKSDFAPYFASIVQLPETFIQLNPDHPLHFVMILHYILAELFQGVRHVEFNSSSSDDSIAAILSDWIMYGENVFDKTFGDDLKAYTHQIYSQPDFARSNYASRLMDNMYSLVRQYFLPFYNMRFYPFKKVHIGRLTAFYPRVRRLRDMLDASIMPHTAEEPDFAEATNAAAIYRFDVPNVVSRHLDSLCGGERSRRRTNEALIRCCSSILSVLDWWINDGTSPAYKVQNPLIYRTTNADTSMPAFGVDARKDTEELFKSSLKKSNTHS